MKLSKRMKALTALVTAQGVLADIGTDHAYVPIALVQQNKIQGAIALDINEGPLLRAKEHIRAAGLQDKIKVRLSDGAAALFPGEADSVLIAGLGGELMLRILQEGRDVCEQAQELILQPQSEIGKVRAYLRKSGYKIDDEDMVCEDGKYYPMMRVHACTEDETWSRLPEQTAVVCDIYGPLLLKNGHPVLRRFLVRQHAQQQRILQTLKRQEQTEPIRQRTLQVQTELLQNESAYTILGAIKNAGI